MKTLNKVICRIIRVKYKRRKPHNKGFLLVQNDKHIAAFLLKDIN